MDEFVTAIKQNIENSSIPTLNKKSSKYVELLRIILANNSEIKILDDKCSEEGDIGFDVPLHTIGLNYDAVLKYKTEFSSQYMVNFLGELFVREHMDKFVKILTDLKGDYHSMVNKYEYRKFGMRFFRDKLSFIFHASLIQMILTEDLKTM